MKIHVLAPLPAPQQQTRADTSRRAPGERTAYDSVWAGGAARTAATQPPAAQGGNALEQTMLSHDKLYVVLAVVLLIWLGVSFLLFRTDRRLAALERRLDDTK